MSDDRTIPEPDRIEGAPHPRETTRLIGQDRAQAEFLSAWRAGRMHSGWLITGPHGVGKATLAYLIAGLLLSDAPAERPPETLDIALDTPDARLVRAGTHPRLFVLKRGLNERGDQLSQTISVEQVRGLKSFFHLSAPDGGHRVVIVDSVDEMAGPAANALLKELEEPPARTTLLLISHQPARLLPTIRSRCRELRCAPLSAQALEAALDQAGHKVEEAGALAALSGGAIGEAIQLLHQDGLERYAELVALFDGLPRIARPAAIALAETCAARGAEARLDLTLDLIDRFLTRAARAGLTGPPAPQAAPGEAALLARLSPDTRAARAWAQAAQVLSDRVRRGRALNLDPAGLILDTVFKIEETAQGVAAG